MSNTPRHCAKCLREPVIPSSSCQHCQLAVCSVTSHCPAISLHPQCHRIWSRNSHMTTSRHGLPIASLFSSWTPRAVLQMHIQASLQPPHPAWLLAIQRSCSLQSSTQLAGLLPMRGPAQHQLPLAALTLVHQQRSAMGPSPGWSTPVAQQPALGSQACLLMGCSCWQLPGALNALPPWAG